MDKFPKDKTVLVDIQFVVGNNNEYYAKEFVFMFADSFIAKQYHLQPPFRQHELSLVARKQNVFNLRNIHGLSWSGGDRNYISLRPIITRLAGFKIIVKGYEKMQFLRQYIPTANIFDMGDKFRLTAEQRVDRNMQLCIIHEIPTLRCSINNVHQILAYLNVNNMLV